MNADVETFAQDVTINEIYGYEPSFQSDVETFVVWVVQVPRRSRQELVNVLRSS